MPNPTNRSQQPAVSIDPSEAPAFLADAPDSVLYLPKHRAKHGAWATAHRDYFLRRFGTVPSLYDVEAERLRRAIANGKRSPQSVEQRVELLPVPTPSTEQPTPLNVAALLGHTFVDDALSLTPGDRRRRHIDAEYDAA